MAKKSARELLIKAATDLFWKKRYLYASVREIGGAAKVNPALVYHYFKNKEEILYTIIERFYNHLINSLQEIQVKETDPIEGLRKMIFLQLLLTREFKKEFMIAQEENTLLKGKFKTKVILYERKNINLYLDQLKKLEQLNMLRQGNLTVFTFSIFGVLNFFYRWYKGGGRLEVETLTGEELAANEEVIANQMIETIFSGILNSNRTTGGDQV